MLKKNLHKTNKGVDKSFLILVILLSFIGLVALADASAPLAQKTFSDKYFFLKQQIIWTSLGFLVLLLLSKINYSFWERIANYLFFIGIVSLVLVFIPGLGARLLGAKRWIVIENFSFQPSEFVKLILAIYLAKVSSKNKKILSFITPILIFSFLVMLQPDLGTTIIILGIGFIQIFVAGIPLLQFFAVIFLGIVTAIVLVLTSDYRRARLMTFLQQTQDPLGKSYHIRQILIALGSGGLLGVGLGQSRQKYLFLPETATDSIFAVIAEEIGFLGSVIIICLFVVFIIKAVKIALNCPDKFSQMLSFGIVSWFVIQILLNLGSMIALVPLTGIPLPFFSYGGSSQIMIFSACAILLNISKYVKKG